MKKLLYIVLLVVSFNSLFSQVLDSEKGKIKNMGRIVVKGQATIGQDTIGGTVEYVQNGNSSRQFIPQLTYFNLKFKGLSEKRIENKKDNIVTMNLFETDNQHTIFMIDSTEIHSKGTTIHNSRINPMYNHGKVVMNGQNAQDITGKGIFKELELNNVSGADVIDSGGFAVNTKLTLRKGEFRNEAANNFVMGDSSEIERYIDGSLRYSPTAEGQYSVRYVGNGDFVSGGEIPSAENALKNLLVENEVTALRLNSNATANDSIYVGATIYTEADTLALTSQKQPIFTSKNDDVEIVGSFKRDNVEAGKKYVLNNPRTSIEFPDNASMKGTKAVTSTIYPDSLPLFIPDKKVTRRFSLVGYDIAGNLIMDSVSFRFDYGWRHSPGSAIDETGNLNFEKIVLTRWIGDSWLRLASSVPIYDTAASWGKGYSTNISNYGAFALGVTDSYTAKLRFYALLEGAYIEGSTNRMRIDLWEKGLLLNAPSKSQYPLSLVKNYNPDSFTQTPDSVVDWVVLEFRTSRNKPGFSKVGFIRYDGKIVDLKGQDIFIVDDGDGLDENNEYFVILRHRNHAPAITAKSFKYVDNAINDEFDWTDPKNIEGGVSSLKMIDILEDRNIFGLKAGFYVDDESINDMIDVVKNFTVTTDWEANYKAFTQEGYLLEDYNLNGIITTTDFNVSWNNRMK